MVRSGRQEALPLAAAAAPPAARPRCRRDQTSAAIAGNVNASLVAGVNLNVRSAPGPDNVNWPALWSTWGQVGEGGGWTGG